VNTKADNGWFGNDLPAAKRDTAYSLSSSLKNLAVSGLLGKYQAAKTAKMTDGTPSIMKSLQKAINNSRKYLHGY
jgi:hypothetical protein